MLSNTNTQLNKAQIGPKTSLTEECKIHPGFKIIFRAGIGGGTEDLCEKCFLEQKHRIDARNQVQESVPAVASDDLLSRLKEPAKPL